MTYPFKVLANGLIERPKVVALLTFLFCFCCAAALVSYESQTLIVKQQHNVFSQLSTIRARLEGIVSANMAVLRGLRAEIALNPKLSQAQFAAITEELLDSGVHIRHIALAPELVVSHIYPRAGNEKVIGLDFRTNPAQAAAVRRAVELREIVLAGPLELVQGGTAMIARVPVFLGRERDQLWGIIAAAIDDEALFREAGLYDPPDNLVLALRGRDAKGADGEVFLGPISLYSSAPVTVDVNLPFGNWQLAAVPRHGWQVPAERLLFLWGSALLIPLIFAALAYLVSRTYREKVEAMRTATYRANFDSLTGLINRSYFQYLLDRVMLESERENGHFALLFIDLDYFKQINDNWGHSYGDLLLVSFAQRLKTAGRRSDLVARLAGDEFVMVLREVASPSHLELFANRLLAELSEPYQLEGRSMAVTASIGIALYPGDGRNSELLLRNADRAMYAAKRDGRNRVFFFNRRLNEEAHRQVELHNNIIQGIERGEFRAYYQPILNMNTGEIDKCEVLLRWQHPERGLLLPGAFIQVAEQTGAIRKLGNWLLEQVGRDYARFREAGLDLTISINRSVNEFYPNDAHEHWLAILETHQLPPSRVVFEITESIFMEGNDNQLQMIDALRDRQVRFSIDDFGTGYSAINYLRSYPVDFIKVDRSFVNDLLEDEQDRTLVEVIIRMGQALGIQVVAEGVEQLAQLQLLEQLGCDYAQGFLFGKPQPLEDFIVLCRSGGEALLADVVD
ncbi:putative bifunctional diguanylate cyclase/phosphodiesterase [Marinobacterium arenosum]|uniref:putative bifunctional diguanylate cyclase/phosphodiesterase n=1 Tax=Marinobacterium arenosum TaxID=2862496 RepID=UPI001C97591F|nr:EAL domain-containing protein [Marinobacterium arenosum]MBY4677030.1 EAL domain-containing protein [Marinobacterium arenosum]